MVQKYSSLALLALLMLSSAKPSPAQEIDANAGQQIFAARCAICHGLDGQGGVRGPNLASSREVQRSSDTALLGIIKRGIPAAGMPAFGTLGGTKLEAVIQHLRLLQGRTAVTVPGNSDRGKALFSGKAGCSQCHAINGAGGFLGSSLSSYAGSQSIENIGAAIVDPYKNLDPSRQIVVVTMSDGTSVEGIARNEDNFSLQLETETGTFLSLIKSDLKKIEHLPRSLMPEDYGTNLTRAEVDDLISYLVEVARVQPKPKSRTKDK